MDHAQALYSFELVLGVRPPHVPVVTVLLREKWYVLYLVTPEGIVSWFDYGVLEGHGIEPYCVDHVPNPAAVEAWAKSRGWEIEPLAFELMVGRWKLDVEDERQ